MQFYKLSISQTASTLKSNIKDGLSNQEVQSRLKFYGLNILPAEKQDSLLVMFFRQFKNPLIYILLFSAVIISFVSNFLDAIIIGVVLIFNAFMGTIQEGRARKILQSLKSYLSPSCLVIREGSRKIIDAAEIVVGDLIVLQEGERVPADARIIAANNLKVDESILTGESSAVLKSNEPLFEDRSIGDQTNMLFSGTYILSGYATALVVATGRETQIGKISKKVETIDSDMPLKRELDYLAHWILMATLLMCFVLFVIGLLLGKTFHELLVILTALFICVIPEGLPVVFTIVLAAGARRMAKQNMLVKRLQAVEGLGRADVILLDKTGTLTRNEMVVMEVVIENSFYKISGEGYFPEGQITLANQKVEVNQIDKFDLVIEGIVLLNQSQVLYLPDLKKFKVKGEPLEAALGVLAQKAGASIEDIKNRYSLIYDKPFDAKSRLHVSIYKTDNNAIAFVLGAPEAVLKICHNKNNAESDLNILLEQGLRVIAMAHINLNLEELADITDFEAFIAQNLFGKFNFLAFFGIQDSIRSDVKEVIEKARSSGLNIVMLTGDHKSTAQFVANYTGILHEKDKLLEGFSLDAMPDNELIKILPQIKVYSRVSPQEKLRIIELFQKRKHIVAMTGDGINDVPSLAAANLGIAMGISGTDVAKEAADLILLDDSFSSIIAAIEEGRHIFYTLRRVIIYFFATNLGEVLVVLFALLSNLPLPILPAQILWLNLVTDGFLDLALSMEPKEKNLLEKSWLHEAQKKGLIDFNMALKIAYMAAPMAIGSIWLFYQYYQDDLAKARTITLVTMAVFQWFNAWNCKSERLSIFQGGLLNNKWLIAATLLVFILQVLVVYVDFLQVIFKTVPIALGDWCKIMIICSSILFLEEARKFFVRAFSKA